MITLPKLTAAIASLSRDPSMNPVLAAATLKGRVKNIPEMLGQAFHESANLSVYTENLNYSADALIKSFSRSRISMEDAHRYGRQVGKPADQEAIANTVYGGTWGKRNLGNTQPNDGWHFRGVGPIQLTGRANITAFARWYGNPLLVNNPQVIAQDRTVGAAALIWYWTVRTRCNDAGNNVSEITRLVTGSPNQGYDQRLKLTRHFRELLK